MKKKLYELIIKRKKIKQEIINIILNRFR